MRQGVREVTLLGQIVNLYGRHEFPAVDGRSPFAQLLRAVSAVPGLDRLRFTSPHPIGFKDDIVACFRDLPNLCPHVHMPLQSGSDRLLKAMHRAYTGAGYRRLIEKLRAAQPGMAFTTDVIVGFPRRDGGRFPRDLRPHPRGRLRQCLHLSATRRAATRPPRPCPDQLPEEVKMERNQRLLALLDEIAAKRNAELVGTRDVILVEGESRTSDRALPGPHAHQPPRPRRGERALARPASPRAPHGIHRLHLLRRAGAAVRELRSGR